MSSHPVTFHPTAPAVPVDIPDIVANALVA